MRLFSSRVIYPTTKSSPSSVPRADIKHMPSSHLRLATKSLQLLRPTALRLITARPLLSIARYNSTITTPPPQTEKKHRYNTANMPPKEKKEKKGAKIDLKTPKGTKDWEGKDMVIRDQIFSKITSVFKKHGAVTIDTPYLLRPVVPLSSLTPSPASSSSAKSSPANMARTPSSSTTLPTKAARSAPSATTSPSPSHAGSP